MSANKARGTRWETAIVNFLRRATGQGTPVNRVVQAGWADQGDIHVGADFALQAKDWETWSRQALYDWVDAANEQAVNAGRPWGVAVVKRRRGKGSDGKVESGLVAMRLDTFAEMLYDLEEGRQALQQLEEETE